jgi:hypothetical protein
VPEKRNAKLKAATNRLCFIAIWSELLGSELRIWARLHCGGWAFYFEPRYA